jgi:hypothetical protein
MHSVVGFALAAPVVVQEHEVRVSMVDAANDLSEPSNPAVVPRTIIDLSSDDSSSPSPSPSPSPVPDPGSTSLSPTSQAPTAEPDQLNPSSPHGNADLNLSSYQDQGPTDISDR